MNETRLANIEKRLDTFENRLDTFELDLSALRDHVSDIHEDTKIIVTAVGGATQVGRFLKVHGPRVIAALVGWLIATGEFDEGFLIMIRTIFTGA